MLTERQFEALEEWIKREADYRAAKMVGRAHVAYREFEMAAIVAREAAHAELCEEPHP